MNLGTYHARIENILRSRTDLDVESLGFRQKNQGTIMTARMRFNDQSLLSILELVVPGDRGTIDRVRYAFHYQSADDRLIFRYDNAPHYPDLPPSPPTNTRQRESSPPQRRT